MQVLLTLLKSTGIKMYAYARPTNYSYSIGGIQIF